MQYTLTFTAEKKLNHILIRIFLIRSYYYYLSYVTVTLLTQLRVASYLHLHLSFAFDQVICKLMKS